MLLTCHGTCHRAWSPGFSSWLILWANQAVFTVPSPPSHFVLTALYLHFMVIVLLPPQACELLEGRSCLVRCSTLTPVPGTEPVWGWVLGEYLVNGMNIEWVMHPSCPVPSVIKHIHVWRQMTGIKESVFSQDHVRLKTLSLISSITKLIAECRQGSLLPQQIHFFFLFWRQQRNQRRVD